MVSILLLRKGTYPYEYMDDQKKFNENLLPEKEGCYSSHLYMEDITDTDYTQVKKVYKNFEIKNFGQNSDLCDQVDYCQQVDLRTFKIYVLKYMNLTLLLLLLHQD